MLLQCGAMLAKKLLAHVDDKITACASSNFVFLRAADWPATNFLEMYCYFPVI